MAKILLVEDDAHMSNVIESWLKNELHTLDCVDRGKDAIHLLKGFEFDAIILDIGLPDMSGLDILRDFRARGGQTPILLLTGKDTVDEKEHGLDAGADDYLTKPFQIKELSARVRALLRRPPIALGNVLKAGRISLDAEKHKVFKNDEPVHLFPREFALLEFFLRHPGKIFSQEALLDRVWKSEADVGPETVRTSLRRLRQQIDTDGEPSIIENVYRVGYRLRDD